MSEHTETFIGTVSNVSIDRGRMPYLSIEYFNNILYHFIQGLVSHNCVGLAWIRAYDHFGGVAGKARW